MLAYDDGIAFVAENPSRALHKISEIYDRIAFAAVGKYNEFENLRVAGVRYADLRGLLLRPQRRDGPRSGQRLRPDPRHGLHPGVQAVRGRDRRRRGRRTPDDDQIYRLTYDGSVADEQGYVAMGGQSDTISTSLAERWRAGLTLGEALGLAVDVLAADPAGGEARHLDAAQLEVAVLDRHRERRAVPSARALARRPAAEPGRPDGRRAAPGRPPSRRHETVSGDEPATPGTPPDRRSRPRRRTPADAPGAPSSVGGPVLQQRDLLGSRQTCSTISVQPQLALPAQ